MPHIHTEPDQHDHTVTAYIVRDDQEELQILLHMHKKLHILLPVGGHIELNETPWAAMAHELEEESGYRLDALDILQPKVRVDLQPDVVIHPQPIVMNTHHIVDGHYHSDAAYLLLAHADPQHMIGDDESSDLRWLTRTEVGALDSKLINQNTQAVCMAVFDGFLDEWEAVPATNFSTNKTVI